MANLEVSTDVDTMMQAATNAAIRAAIGTAIGSNVQAWTAILDATTASFTTALAANILTNSGKLTADTANVTSAGALMDSELTSIASVKALDQGCATTDSPAFADIQITGHAYADAEVDDGNSSTADTIDWTTGNFHKSTLTGNVTYTFTPPSGPTTLILRVVQDGTGSRTATWPASVHWTAGSAPTITTSAASVDIIGLYYDGTNYHGSVTPDSR